MSWNTFLDDVREAARAAADLPDDAVSVYQQQDVLEMVNNAIALHSCAVILLLTGGRSAADGQVATKKLNMNLEIEVWTPEVLMSGQTLTSLQAAEWLIAALHGWKPVGVAAANGGARVLSFRTLALRREEDQRTDSKFLVANLIFEVPLVPVGPG